MKIRSWLTSSNYFKMPATTFPRSCWIPRPWGMEFEPVHLRSGYRRPCVYSGPNYGGRDLMLFTFTISSLPYRRLSLDLAAEREFPS